MIRRAEPKDAELIAAFLKAEFAADATSGGNPDAVSAEMIAKALAAKPVDCWLYLDDTAKVPTILGVLLGQDNAVVEILGKTFTSNIFKLLVVHHAAEHVQKVEMSKGLTLFAADDLTAEGTAREIIWVQGPLDSKGGEWADLLEMSKDDKGGTDPHRYCNWYLPFAEIWDKANGVVAARG
jgi:hypothetical protein